MPGSKKKNPAQLRRCVRAILKGKGIDSPNREQLSSAFAICTAQLQKGGYLKRGTRDVTKKGATRSRSKAAELGHGSKVAEYEKMLQGARTEGVENDVGPFGMDPATRKRLKVKNIHQKGKKKPEKPMRSHLPYGLREVNAFLGEAVDALSEAFREGTASHFNSLLVKLFKPYKEVKIHWKFRKRGKKTYSYFIIEMPSKDWYYDVFAKDKAQYELNRLVNQFNVKYEWQGKNFIVQ